MSETLTAERFTKKRIAELRTEVTANWRNADFPTLNYREIRLLLDAAEENGRLKVSADNLVLQAESIPATLEEVTRNLRTIAGYFMQRYGTYEKTCEAASLLDGTELLLLELLLDKFNLLVQLRNTMIEGDAALAQLAEWREVAENANRRIEDGNDYGLSDSMEEISALSEKHPKGGE